MPLPPPPRSTVLRRLELTDETIVAGALDQVAAAMGEEVGLGSYPVTDQSDGAGVVLSLESRSCELLARARRLLLERLPEGVLLTEQRDSDSVSSPVAPQGLGPAGPAHHPFS